MRERTRVPLTYALVETAVTIIDGTFGRPEDRLTLRAALAVSYGLSLRPGEYLAMTEAAARRPDEQATAGAAYIWPGLLRVCEPEKFPDGPAETFTLLVDFLKQYPSGKGMPRAVAQPSTPVSFSCVSAIEAYARSRHLGPLTHPHDGRSST